jgi:VCBS repeat-containing protein
MNVGATGDPALPANPATLTPLTINGDSGLSALDAYGNLTQNSDGSYTFNANGNQVPSLNLNNVNNLTVTDAVFANAGSTNGGLTISGDSNDVVVTNSTFSGDQYGINVDGSNNVVPTNIGIINNSFSNMDGLFPDGSPIQFLGDGTSSIPAAANGENLIANNTINGTEQAVGSETGIDLLSIYSYANGTNNADTLIYGNSISGSTQLAGGGQTNGAGIIAELDPGTTGTPTVTAANNFITDSTGIGLTNGGSDANFIGNLVTNTTSDVTLGTEGGYNPMGTFTYNETDNSPAVPVAQNQGGWPVIYAPSGPPNDPGNTNSWDA